MAWIEVNKFTYTYPGESSPALNDVTLSLEKGAFAVLTGNPVAANPPWVKPLLGFFLPMIHNNTQARSS